MKNFWISVVLLALLSLPGWASVGQQSDGLSDLEHVNTNGKNAVKTGQKSKDEVSLKGRILPWDVNRDGEVNIADVNNVIDYILYGSQQEISSAYYYVGTSNGWTPCDATYKLDNGGGDVYSNPVFSVVIPAMYDEFSGGRVDNFFKICSQETMDLGADGFWNGDFIGKATNISDHEMSGYFVEDAYDHVFSFVIPGEIPADKYRLTFDMINRSYEFEAIKESPDLWYLVGSCIGDGSWSNNYYALGTSLVPLYPQPDNKFMLKYVGYFPAGKGFRLIHMPGRWDEQWGMSDGHLVKNDISSDGIEVAEDGYYQITYDTEMDVVTITKYTEYVSSVFTSMSMPGEYQGDQAWDPASAPLMSPMGTVFENHDWIKRNMTFDSDTELKFTADGGWYMNWGSEAFPIGVGMQYGPNIPVSAGTYTVVFNDILGTYYFIEKPE
jgi:hypothetical protein